MGNKLTESVRRVFSVLEAFSIMSPAMTLQQVANKVGLPKVTALRYLYTLTLLGYISREANPAFYRLSPRVLDLGFTVLGGMELRQVAMPYLEELARISDQNVSLGILEKTEIMYVERIRRRRIVNIYSIGSRVNSYRSSIGCALLAFLPEADLQSTVAEILNKQPDAAKHLGPKGKQLFKLLKQVRKNGYAVNNEQFIPGMRGIGAPVLDARGAAEGAINIAVYSAEVSLTELIDRYVPLLLETARKISLVRGCPVAAAAVLASR
jgi:IclR family pca regulon transcriptional regulator